MTVAMENRLSVIICTRNRRESLRITLDCLANADREGLDVNLIVVDNTKDGVSKDVVDSFAGKISVQYLLEPVEGKSHALNRALREGNLGEIIAVLDDDMSPHPDWLQGVVAICRRWPDKMFFSGRSYVIWPYSDVPSWTKKGSLLGWAFSVVDPGAVDQPIPPDRWPPGGHFWFRSKALNIVPRFETPVPPYYIEMPEPKFILDLAEKGVRGTYGAEAVTGHRIQPRLLNPSVLTQRAAWTGRGFAESRIRPYRKIVKQARLFRKYPLLSRLFCLFSVARWACIYYLARLKRDLDDRFELSLLAIERMATYSELLRLAKTIREYKIFNRLPLP